MLETPKYLSDQDNLALLNDQIAEDTKQLYEEFTYNRLDPGFAGKIYVIYQPNGRHDDPNILGQVRIVDWTASAKQGPSVVLEDMQTGQLMTVGIVPTRIFEYDVFLSCAPYSRLRFDARMANGAIVRSMLFSLLIKTATRADQFTPGVTYCEPLKPFKGLYPDLSFALSYY